jgi:initiation factor 1A
MPQRNLRGGKAYKKTKKGGDPSERQTKFVGRDIGQDYARVLRMLGDRRVLCFGNDGVEHIAKIRGSLCKGPKKQIIEVGDLVLVSSRNFEVVRTDSASDSESETTASGLDMKGAKQKEVLDLLEKIPHNHWRFVRKEAGIHRDLFLGGTEGSGSGAAGGDMDDIFDDGSDGVPATQETMDAGDDSDVDIDAL